MLIQSIYIPIVRSYGDGALFWVDKVFHCWFINWFYWFDTFKFKLPLRKPPDKILESIGRPQAVSRAPCWAFSPHRTLALCTTLPTWWYSIQLVGGRVPDQWCCWREELLHISPLPPQPGQTYSREAARIYFAPSSSSSSLSSSVDIHYKQFLTFLRVNLCHFILLLSPCNFRPHGA